MERRYKHFDWLHDRLVEKFTVLAVPPLPDKQYAGKDNCCDVFVTVQDEFKFATRLQHLFHLSIASFHRFLIILLRQSERVLLNVFSMCCVRKSPYRETCVVRSRRVLFS